MKHKSRQPLREVLNQLEALGSLTFAPMSDGVVAYEGEAIHEDVTELLRPYSHYLSACLVKYEFKRLTLAELRSALGFSGCPHRPGQVLRLRDALMEQAGYAQDRPWTGEFEPTLTLEEIQEVANVCSR